MCLFRQGSGKFFYVYVHNSTSFLVKNQILSKRDLESNENPRHKELFYRWLILQTDLNQSVLFLKLSGACKNTKL